MACLVQKDGALECLTRVDMLSPSRHHPTEKKIKGEILAKLENFAIVGLPPQTPL